jgi:hypothetical protein
MGLEWQMKNAFFTSVRWALIALFAVVAYQVIDYSIKLTTPSSKNSCVANLKQILGAKLSWALEKRETNNAAVPLDSDLFGPHAYMRVKPTCDEGGIYTLGSIVEYTRCSIPMHSLEAGHVYVRDELGNPLVDASVSVNGSKGSDTSVNTDTNGFAHVNCWAGGATAVLISKANYEARETSLTNYWPFRITLKKSAP